eukprot:g13793.t1
MKSKEIELTEAPREAPKQKLDVPITFCTHVGWDGVLLLLFSLGISGLFIYVYVLYTQGFLKWHRPWVWVFMVLAGLYLLLVVKYLCTWEKMAGQFSHQQQAEKEQHQGRQKRSTSAVERATFNAKNVYNRFQVNGPWFLWKLYISELFESCQQCNNLLTIYLCSLPVEWSIFMCCGLAVESFHTAWTMTHDNTPVRRDRQVKIDAGTDFACVVIPLIVPYVGYQLQISISDMLFITLVPSLSMLSKLDDLLEEGLRQRVAESVLKEQSRLSTYMKRHRKSLFHSLAHVSMAKKQEDAVPQAVRVFAAMCKALFGLFFLMTAIIHIALKPSGCGALWGTGCVTKIPFCNGLLSPTCNCASLRIENDKSLVKLPDSMVDDMQALRKVFIRNCNLTTLPPKMEQLTEMVDFEVSFNRLERFDVDVSKWKKLQTLYLMQNEIISVNQAVWKHVELSALHLWKNSMVALPKTSEIYMPSLNFLHIGDNNMTVHNAIGRESFPVLMGVYINGNAIEAFPSDDLKDTLVKLGISRCSLNALPSYLSAFNQLRYLDARDNSVGAIGDDLKTLLRKNDVEAYFSGNAVLCNAEKELDCTPLCSNTCWSKRVSANGRCDETCFMAECKFDGGDCSFR